MKPLVILAFCLLVSLSAVAQLKLARLFTDHAVLQRRKSVLVWGWAKPGETITVLFNGQSVRTKAAADGRWRTTLRPMEAGGPFTLQVSSGKNTLAIEDILIGEVWLCSGQSNMEMRVSASSDARAEIQSAIYPQIRHFKVPNEMALQPQADLSGGDWQVCSPKTVGAFSGVGVYPVNGLRYSAQEEPVSVSAIHTTKRPHIFREVPEDTTFTLEFSSGLVGKGRTSGMQNTNFLHITAASGWYRLSPFSGYDSLAGNASNGMIFKDVIPNQQAKQMGEDALAILQKKPLLIPGEEGMRDIHILEAINQSASLGGKTIAL